MGTKHFFTNYGALRHIVRIELLQELEREVSKTLEAEGNWYALNKEAVDPAFKAKYGNGYYHSYENPGISTFAKAITRRASEIKERLGADY